MSVFVVHSLCFFLLFFLSVLAETQETWGEYLLTRRALIHQERDLSFSAGITLSQMEKKIDYYLAQLREDDLSWMDIRQNFLLNQDKISASPLFASLQSIPKGGILHAHWDSSWSYHSLVYNYTYDPHCFFYAPGLNQTQVGDEKYDYASLWFFQDVDAALADDPNWVEISYARSVWPSESEFNQQLYLNLTLQWEEVQPYNLPWGEFQTIFGRIDGAFHYTPLLRLYYLELFQNLEQINILHVEFRFLPASNAFYDLNHDLSINETINFVYSVWQEYLQNNPSSTLTLRVIWASVRSNDLEEIQLELQTAVEMMKQYPEFLVGFDLVGQEDPGHTLEYFSSVLFEALPNGAAYYFHAGETLDPSNQNLYDAILLNTARIGHGVALMQHPLLLEEVKEKGIAVEVSPISNQILGFVFDMQAHPALQMLRAGVPITLNPDDPAIFGYGPVTYDWYEAYVSWNLTLADLKQLAYNSIEYSALDANTKSQQLATWNSQWDRWTQTFFMDL